MPLTEKMFGKEKKYRYRLELDEEIPEVLYRDRNFSLKVRLVDQSNHKVMNINAVTLQLDICDNNGEWITQKNAKGNIMKGITESELFQG